jgi:5'-phosphate synthase pdxT subunit
MRIGVLALQGDVREHQQVLHAMGVEPCLLRGPEDLDGIEGLILPGGESTTISMLLESSGLGPELARWVAEDRPTLGTCAGLVLLAETVIDGRAEQEGLGGLDVTVQRNGYGRQRQSFEASVWAPALGAPLEAVFIRAPRIISMGPDVEVLGRLDGPRGEPVICQQGSLLACSFHPELTGEARLHERLMELIEAGTPAG